MNSRTIVARVGAFHSVVEFVTIVLLAVLGAVTYGILHDQVTARVCVEYFTIGHPPIFHTDSPTLLSLGWGILATWWAGAIIGVLAALAARVGSWPRLTARQLVKPVIVLFFFAGILSLFSGIAGYWIFQAKEFELAAPLTHRVPLEKHALFFADACAHLAAYGVGFLGGIIICVRIIIKRRRLASMRSQST